MRATDDTSGDQSKMIRACKICLVTEGKLQRITSEEVRNSYRNLTGIEWDMSGRLPQHMCAECGARLRGTVGLRRKALASLRLLDEILALEPSVTSSHIHLADRTRRSLKSNLRTMHFTPNDYLAGTSTKCDKQTNTEYDDLVVRKCCQDRIKTYKNHKLDAIKNIEHAISKDNGSSIGNSNLEHGRKKKVIRTAGHASDTGSLQMVAVDAAVDKTYNDYDSDNSEEKLLVIDIEEPMETVLSSEYVGNSGGAMPIDELIDIYNNNEDGDGRLQELNENFAGESTIQIDQGWGVQREAGGGPRVRAVRGAPVPAGPRGGGRTTKRNTSKDFYMTEPYRRLNRDLFTFIRVSELEQIAEVNKRQFTLQFREAALKCFVCFRYFTGQLAYDAHMQRHNPIRGDIECSICKVRHASARALRNHVDNNHVVKIVCNGCDFVTMNRGVAHNHEKMHGGVIYKCNHCHQQFKQQSTYKSHLRRRHLLASACVLCGSTFHSKKGLAVHRCRKHPNADQVPLHGPYCGPCDLVFASGDAYTRHLSLSSRHGPYSSNNAPSDVSRN